MIRSMGITLSIVFVSVFIFINVPFVKAQESDGFEFTLEEITVTAQKREENQQKVAITMETISGEELAEKGVTTMADALAGIAASFVQDTGKDYNIVARGLVNNAKPGDSVNPIGVSVDGAYSNNYLTGQTGFYDMQRVEVLLGPQGTLYSRNSSGGVINMVSNDPSTERFAGSASLGIGNYRLRNSQGMINVPLSDKIALRAAFNTISHDGYLSNGTVDDDTKSMRLKVGYVPSENLSAVLTYESTTAGGLAGGGFVIPFENQDDVDDPWTSDIPAWVYHNDRKTDRLFINMNWSTPIGNVTVIPSYSKYKDNVRQQDALLVGSNGLPGGGGPSGSGTIVGWRPQNRKNEQKEKSLEVRMASLDDFFMKWVVGFYYYNQSWMNAYTKPLTESGGLTWDFIESWQYRKNPSYALFGNFTVPLTETFRVTTGGRYTKDKETDTSYDSSGGMSGTDFYSGPDVYKDSHFDYKIGAEYDLGADMMLWVDYSTGYKRGFKANPAQELKSYQIGEKGRFFNQKLQMNATAYYYDYLNFYIDAGGQVINSVDYMGTGYADANIYGLDLSTDYIVTSQDRINLSVSYVHSEVKEALIIYSTMAGDELPAVYWDSDLPSLNCSPEFTIAAGYEHRFDLSNGGALLFEIDPRYTTEQTIQFQPSGNFTNSTLDINEVNKQEAFLKIDASLNYSDPSNKWSLNGYVKNITNYAQKSGFYIGVDYIQVSAPRTYGAVLTVRY